MKLAHQIKIKVFSYEKNNEDDKLILDKFLQLFPFDLKDEKIELNKTNTKGFEERKITIFEVKLTKEKHTKQFLENLIQNIDEEQKKLILAQLESRLDDNLDFFLRFDKSEYLKNDKLKLTDSGNCIHVEISVAAFPKKREIGLEIVKEVFS
jgi:RNA binding exosome subunit